MNDGIFVNMKVSQAEPASSVNQVDENGKE